MSYWLSNSPTWSEAVDVVAAWNGDDRQPARWIEETIRFAKLGPARLRGPDEGDFSRAFCILPSEIRDALAVIRTLTGSFPYKGAKESEDDFRRRLSDWTKPGACRQWKDAILAGAEVRALQWVTHSFAQDAGWRQIVNDDRYGHERAIPGDRHVHIFWPTVENERDCKFLLFAEVVDSGGPAVQVRKGQVTVGQIAWTTIERSYWQVEDGWVRGQTGRIRSVKNGATSASGDAAGVEMHPKFG